MRTPPKLATALLVRLGPNDPALAGDLIEAYRAGRSALWYWCQVVTSIPISAGLELWGHKWLGVHAAATFFGVQFMLSALWKRLWFSTTLSARVQEFTVVVWGPQDPLLNAPYRWIFTLALLPLTFATGWVVARVHQRDRGAAVIMCCIVAGAMGLPRLVALMSDARLLNLYLHVASMVVMLVGLLCGAFVAGSREPQIES